MRTHQDIERRSLELHRLAAQKLRQDPALFDVVRANIARRQLTTSINSRPYLDEWNRLVHEGIDRCLAVATEESEKATALRQASPFAGVLTPLERATFLRQWSRSHEA